MADQQILAPDAPIPGTPLSRNAVSGGNYGLDGLRGLGRQPAVRKALPLIALTGAVVAAPAADGKLGFALTGIAARAALAGARADLDVTADVSSGGSVAAKLRIAGE